MQDRQRESSADSPIDNSANVVSFKEAIERKYNPRAAFYALPKAFINRLLPRLSGNTLKVFLALVNHTDCWNVIKYPDKITHSALMKSTGIKKKDTISKAYRDLCNFSIIGGYVPGHGSSSTEFYFTFDIDHYRTGECCLKLEEISPYYEMLFSGKYSNPGPEGYQAHPGAGEGSPEKRDTSKIINILITNAGKDSEFKHEFNEFCTEDTSKYLKDTLFWIARNAVEFNLSLGEVIDSLSAANEKSKQGSMSYLIGIMRNKSQNKAGGIRVITRPLLVQVKRYFQERFSHCLDYLESYDFNVELNQLQYRLKNPQADKDSMDEFFRFVVDDIKHAVGVSLAAVEIA